MLTTTFSTNPYRAEDAPVFTAATRLLVVAPHPDDETIATGGLIQAVRAVGGDVTVLLATNGDNNPWPQRWMERRLLIDAAARRRWGSRRRGEVAAALVRLGVPADRILPLGWSDMGITDQLRRNHEGALSAFAEAIAEASPTLVAMPALGDRHPDHGACHVLTRLAVDRLGHTAACIDYMVHGTARPGPAFTLDMSPAAAAIKHEALLSHATQTVLSRGRMERMASRPERYGQLGLPTAAGRSIGLPWQPSPLWAARLRLTVVDRSATRVFPWSATRQAADGGRCLDLPTSPSGPLFIKLSADLPSPWIFDRWGWAASGDGLAAGE
jgi:N-acetyl-1-D-myo-inositol-2-amino-2-deoxy-alpha-D-glucopyranoside deacetylase